MDEQPETFEAWRERTTPNQSLGYRGWRLVALVVFAAFLVLSMSGHFGWGLIVSLLAPAAIWVVERVSFKRSLTGRDRR